MKSNKLTIKELGFVLIDNSWLTPVLLKRVSVIESRIIDAYREVNKNDAEVDFIKEMMDDENIYNIVKNEKEILVYK